SDIVVFGRRAGAAAASFATGQGHPGDVEESASRANEALHSALRGGDEDLRSVEMDLAAAMWECCGVVRDESRLAEGERRLEEITGRLARTAVRSGSAAWGDLARRLDLEAGVVTAAASLRGAKARTETRGCHNRADFPEV